MNALLRYVGTSIGKKQLIALTGLMLCGFLGGHLAGNFLLYKGMEAFNHYAEFLSENMALPIVELGLLGIFALHIGLACWATWENWAARPERYAVRENAGGRTLGSATMIYTGLLLLTFLLVHVTSFRLLENEDPNGVFGMVIACFQRGGFVLFYLAALAVLGVHLSHGVQSAFQTLGADHPNLTPAVKNGGLLFAVAVAAAFGMMPVWAHLVHGG
ncbi:MAG: succinate dehydrogenase cytochrome b subunit [Elusimicrobiota bacterium]|jgi:succinate dehydrogenase / fumarate reductase cytochrome b subunit